jgi:hypothetical protein
MRMRRTVDEDGRGGRREAPVRFTLSHNRPKDGSTAAAAGMRDEYEQE